MQTQKHETKELNTDAISIDLPANPLELEITASSATDLTTCQDSEDSEASEGAIEIDTEDSGEESEDEDDEEPFETYKLKVLQLCDDLGFGEPKYLEHMEGGSYHRIVGVQFDSLDRRNCVLRIPRTPWNDLEPNEVSDQISILQHLSQYKYLHIPSVLAYDMTVNNPLQTQYVLQSRLSGESLETIYYDLPFTEKLQITAAVAEMMIKLESIKLDKPGRLIGKRILPQVANAAPSSTTGIDITGFRAAPHSDMETFETQPLRCLLQSLFRFRREDDADWPQMVQRCYRLEDIAREMEVAGLMRVADTQNVLWHWDFAARNILIKRVEDVVAATELEAGRIPISQSADLLGSNSETSSTKSRDDGEKFGTTDEKALWKITGVLDWDDVLSVPLVLSRKPPAWLWFNEDERIGWNGNNDVPPTRDLTLDELLIKARFDQIMAKADPTYIEDAYHRGPWLRSLARFGLYGFGDAVDWQRYEVFVREWEEYYKSTGCQIPKEETLVEDDGSEDSGKEDDLSEEHVGAVSEDEAEEDQT